MSILTELNYSFPGRAISMAKAPEGATRGDMLKLVEWAGAPVTLAELDAAKPAYDAHIKQIQSKPPEAPQVITMRQARLALLSAGLLSQVDAAIAAISDPVQQQAAQIEWEYSATVERNATWVVALAPQLGLDNAALDQLFTEASKL